MKDWPVPAVAFVISGRQHGYLEPCGCSETQSGGVSRRADLFRQMRDKGWPIAAFDLGGTVRRTRLQSRYKFETILAALKDMQYAGIALGPDELKFGPEYLLSLNAGDGSGVGTSATFLAANVVFFDSPDLGTPARWKLVTVNGLKIAVTGILGRQYQSQVLDSQITTNDPAEALESVVPQMEAQRPDLMVLLSHADEEASLKLAERFPQFNLVATAGGPEDPDGRPKFAGNAMLLSVGAKGKYVGVVGYYPQQEQNRFRFELVDLDNRRFADTPQMTAHMEYYQERLKEFHDDVFADLPVGPHPSGEEFVGAAKCGECHKKAYAKWKDTPHAHAYESLIKGRKEQATPFVPRTYDPECLCCHTTGWNPQDVARYESGFYSEASTPHLMGQQCENCHGPGSRHTELELLRKQSGGETEALIAERKALHMTTDTAKVRICNQCHDLDNSPHFDFDKYWEKIKHPWRD